MEPCTACPSPSPRAASMTGHGFPGPGTGRAGSQQGETHAVLSTQGAEPDTRVAPHEAPRAGLGGQTQDSPALAVQEHRAAAVHKGRADG